MISTDTGSVWYYGDMDYITVQQAANELRLSARGVRERIERGEMTADQLGPRLWAIAREEVERQRLIGRFKPGPKPKNNERATRGE